VAELRSLVLVLGDQLDLEASAFDGFDPQLDAVWMAEVAEESTHVASSRPRTVMFLAAMRHFALALQAAGRPLLYTRLDAPGNRGSLAAQLQADIERLQPARLVMTAPGDWRVLQAIKSVAGACGASLEIREDRHFFVSVREFAAHARGRKSLRMEYFYREQRKQHRVLMDPQDEDAPLGGQWNFDADNREAFGAAGPGAVPPRCTFEPDGVRPAAAQPGEGVVLDLRSGRSSLVVQDDPVGALGGAGDIAEGIILDEQTGAGIGTHRIKHTDSADALGVRLDVVETVVGNGYRIRALVEEHCMHVAG